MQAKQTMWGRKVVTQHHVKPDQVQIPPISQKVQQVIRDAKVKSLEPLIGPDSERATRQLIQQYWEVT